MYRYLELIETLSEDEQAEKLPGIVRIEVTDKADADKKSPTYEALFTNKKYISRYHEHTHTHTGDNIPCECTTIKEVGVLP
jgi:hypothetical protein